MEEIRFKQIETFNENQEKLLNSIKFHSHPNNSHSYTNISLANKYDRNYLQHSSSTSKINLEFYDLSKKHTNRYKFTKTDNNSVSYKNDINLGDEPRISSRNKQNTPVQHDFHKNKLISAHLHVDKKFIILYEKVLNSLYGIRECFEKGGITAADGEEDDNRRQIRVKEFSSRFSRNYLYPLLRQLEQIEKSNTDNSKLFACYQLVLNGLQSFQTHLPTTIGNQAIDKFKILLKNLIKLVQLHEKFVILPDENDIFDLINNLESFTNNTLQIVNESKLIQVPIEKPKTVSKKRNVVKKQKNNRLYMYSLPPNTLRNSNLKQTVEKLAKKRYSNVSSRYKTALIKPKTENFVSKNSPVGNNVKGKKNNVKSCSSADGLINRIEDNVETLIQMQEKSTDNLEIGDNINLEQQELSKKLYNLAKNESNFNTNDFNVFESEENVEDLIKQCWNVEGGQKILRKLIDTLEKRQQDTKKTQIIKESGAKNARLICITDYNNDNNDEVTDKKQLVTIHTQTEDEIKEKSVKISRLVNKLPVLEMLPANFGLNIIKYKLDFKEYCKTKPLYMRTKHIQPWILFENLSDDIFNECLENVLKEVEFNLTDVVDKIYQSELRF